MKKTVSSLNSNTYKSLYRQYRPQNFNEVVGQDVIVKTLQNAVKNNRINHAYLFSGPRGTGKTTIAKIFARMINCTGDHPPCGSCPNCRLALNQNHPDIIEIDAASNNGVDEVRNLIDQIQYAPLQGKYKVYIIDEVHMMSTGAFNALLKTIEEPPEDVIFILATTEPHKVIETILSRCQRFDFNKVGIHDLTTRLNQVINAEKISADSHAVHMIAQMADGGVRDALSILDQLLAYDSEISEETIESVFGLVSQTNMKDLLILLSKSELDEAIALLKNLYFSGKDLKRFIEGWTTFLKNHLIYLKNPQTPLLTDDQKLVYSDMKSISLPLEFGLLNDLLDLKHVGNNQLTLDKLETLCLRNSILLDESDGNLAHRETLSIPPLQTTQVTSNSYVPVKSDSSVIKPKISEIQLHSDYSYDQQTDEERNPKSQISDVSRETMKKESKTRKIIEFDLEKLLQILVQASKDFKSHDNERWKEFENSAKSFEEIKLSKSLSHSKIIASTEKYLLLGTKKAAEANKINQLQASEGYEVYLNHLIGNPKSPIALGPKKMNELLTEFRNRRNQNTLPKPEKINLFQEREPKDAADHLKEIFEDLVIQQD